MKPVHYVPFLPFVVLVLAIAVNQCRPRDPSLVRGLPINQAYVGGCGAERPMPRAYTNSIDQQMKLTGSTLVDDVNVIFENHACVDCHFPGSTEGASNFQDVLDVSDLRRNGLLDGKDPEDTRFYRSLVRARAYMPKDGDRLSADELKTVRHWIAEGAPALRVRSRPVVEEIVSTDIDFISDEDKIACIKKDLDQFPRSEGHFLRYFTFVHFLNAGESEQMPTFRAALAKLINSLSWNPQITPPVAIDETHTIYRVDLRDYGWTNQTWEMIQTRNPYAFSYTNRQATPLYDYFGWRGKYSHRPKVLPYMRGDWFIAAASIPPLYYDLLGIGDNLEQFFDKLHIPYEHLYAENKFERAGISQFDSLFERNRIIERGPSRFGSFWRTFDFGNSQGTRDIYDRPLGPCSLGNETADCNRAQDLIDKRVFFHDGSEFIFSLPNGLHGYGIFSGPADHGSRKASAHQLIISDPKSEDGRVIAGRSCMGCHTHGLLPRLKADGAVPLSDRVRPFAQVQGGVYSQEVLKKVLALYPEKESLDRKFRDDVSRYRRALAKTGVEAMDVDPVFAAGRFYKEDPITFVEAAGELAIRARSLEEKMKEDRLLNDRLFELTLGGRMSRDTMHSQFPELMESLRSDVDHFTSREAIEYVTRY